MERIINMLQEQRRINVEQQRVNEEQKRVNEELMNQMHQMQEEIMRLSGPRNMMGMGYRENMGGGKMSNSFNGNRPAPYNRNTPSANGGDWTCPKCGNLNFERREQCNMRNCNFQRRDLEGFSSWMGSKGVESRSGDWDCPRCQNVNFSHRNICNGKSNKDPCNLRKPDFEQFQVPLLRNKERRQPGDWACLRCGNINYPSRENCNKCELSKEDGTREEDFRWKESGNEESTEATNNGVEEQQGSWQSFKQGIQEQNVTEGYANEQQNAVNGELEPQDRI